MMGGSNPLETPVAPGVATSTAVGIFLGLYPAHRASRLDPGAALCVQREISYNLLNSI